MLCETCQYFDGIYSRQPYCRRYPPQVTYASLVTTYWPTVNIQDWCGEFKEKEKDENIH